MNKYNVAGILRTYSEQCAKVESNKQLLKVIRNLQDELKDQIREIKQAGEVKQDGQP